MPLHQIGRHGLIGNFQQFAGLLGRTNLVAGRGMQAVEYIFASMRSSTGNDLEENAAQQLDITPLADFLDRPSRHFGGHVRRRAPHTLRLRDASRS